MKEIWKDIDGFEVYYQVSNLGRVMSFHGKSTRIISGSKAGSGYTKIIFRGGGKDEHRYLHRIVASAFIPNHQGKRCVNHKNGIKNDNRVSNLEWVTHSENKKHAASELFVGIGENNGYNTLTENDVLQIRSIYEQGWLSQYKIANAYKVSVMTINRAIRGISWSHI